MGHFLRQGLDLSLCVACRISGARSLSLLSCPVVDAQQLPPPSDSTPFLTLPHLWGGVGWAGCGVSVRCGCVPLLQFHAQSLPRREGGACPTLHPGPSRDRRGPQDPRRRWLGFQARSWIGSLCAPASSYGQWLCRLSCVPMLGGAGKL